MLFPSINAGIFHLYLNDSPSYKDPKKQTHPSPRGPCLVEDFLGAEKMGMLRADWSLLWDRNSVYGVSDSPAEFYIARPNLHRSAERTGVMKGG